MTSSLSSTTTGLLSAPLEAILVAGPAFLAAGGLATAMMFARGLAFGIAPDTGPAVFALCSTITGVLLIALGGIGEYPRTGEIVEA